MKKITKVMMFMFLTMFLVFTTSCALFAPKLRGSTHVLKAIDGAKQIQETKEGKAVDEKLLELFNAEFVLAYQETSEAINSAKSDVALYASMPIEDYEKLSTLYQVISSKYGAMIISAVDYPALIEGLDKKASKELLDAAKNIVQSTTNFDKLNDAAEYLKKSISLDSEYESESKEILIDIYIRLGDIKVESLKLTEVETALSYYNKAYVLDKSNKKAEERLAYAEEKRVEIKINSVKETIRTGQSFKEFHEALKTFDSLGSTVDKKYMYLRAELEEKLTADILICVGPSFKRNLNPKTDTFTSSSRPLKVNIEYKKLRSLNSSVPTTHTFVLMPDKDFGTYSYDYKTSTSREITVDSADDDVQRALYKMRLEQDPNNLEARNALAKGVYVKVTTEITKTMNDVYHYYKIENGNPILKHSTSPSVVKETIEQIKFVSGSVAPVEKAEGITFTSGNIAGEEFNPRNLKSYFSDELSKDTLYFREMFGSKDLIYQNLDLYVW